MDYIGSMINTIFKILVLLLGFYFFYLAHDFLKTGKAFIPIVYFDKQENPRTFWIIVYGYIIFGIWIIIMVIRALILGL